jgi:branched-chain amino acid aminotransferase
MNVFFRINDTLLTAPVSDRILDGVTRKSIIDLAENEGIPVEVRKVTVHELVAAAKDGSLKEIFGAGTAVTVGPVKSFAYDGVDYPVIPPAESYAARFKERLLNIQYNLAPDPFGWRYQVTENNY